MGRGAAWRLRPTARSPRDSWAARAGGGSNVALSFHEHRQGQLMRFQTENVMQSLEHMAHGLADLDRHARMLATATAEGNLVASISATEGSRRALGTIVAITVTLQQQVVSTDNLGKTLSSVGELVLRASQVVLL